MDARELEQAKQRHVERQRLLLAANPDLTDAERRSAMLTGYVSEDARKAEEEAWQKRGEENRRREQEREQRANLERQLLGQARRAGLHLVHADDGLKWKRARPQGSVRRRGASRERRPSARRTIRRCARSPGRRASEPPPEPELVRGARP